jgi:hypothetical protein
MGADESKCQDDTWKSKDEFVVDGVLQELSCHHITQIKENKLICWKKKKGSGTQPLAKNFKENVCYKIGDEPPDITNFYIKREDPCKGPDSILGKITKMVWPGAVGHGEKVPEYPGAWASQKCDACCEDEDSSKLGMIIGCVVGGLVGIFILMLLFIKYKSGKKERLMEVRRGEHQLNRRWQTSV